MEDKMTEQESEVIGSAGLQLSRSELAQMIDISAVQAFHTEEDVRNLAGLALEQRFIAAHARPHFVPLLRSLIRSMAQRSWAVR
jgi:deoxyribose-phosphate aldolase